MNKLHTRPGAERLAPLGVSLLAALLAALAWRTGAGFGPDSVTYVDVAQNLLAGRGFVHHWAYWDPVYETCKLPTGTTLWPPGYSLAIAALAWLGLSAENAARAVSAASFVLLPLPLFAIVRRTTTTLPATLATLCATGLFPLTIMSAAVATEMPFLLIATTCAWAVLRAAAPGIPSHPAAPVEPRHADRWWLLAGALAGLSFSLRYVGVACIAGIALGALLLAGRNRVRALVASMLPAAILAAAAILPGWLAQRGHGPNWPGADIFWTTLPGALRGVVGALIGSKELLDERPWSLLRPAQLALAALLAVTFVFAVARRPRSAPIAARGPANPTSIVLALFSFLYVAAVLAGRLQKGMDVEERYLTLIGPWIIAILAVWTMPPPGEFASRRVRFAIPLFLALFVCQIGVTGRWLMRSDDPGYVLAARHCPAVTWIRKNLPADEPLLNTRGADLALWVPNPMLRLPRQPFSRIRTVAWDTVDEIAARAGARYLIHWPGFPDRSKYDDAEFKFLRSLDDPAAHPGRDPVILPDSILYRVGPAQ